MKKRALSICICLGITMALFAGCGSADQKKAARKNTEAVQETGTEALSKLMEKDTEVAEVTETTEASETSDPAASVDASAVSAEASASGNDAVASGSTAKADTKNKSAAKSGSKSDSNSGSASQASQPAAASGSGSAKADNTVAPAQQTTSAQPASQPQPAAHEHQWEQYVKDTINHPEVGHYETKVVQAAYDEPKYEEHNVCNKCGKDLGTSGDAIADHAFDCYGSYSLVPVQVGTIHHDAVTEQVYVVDQAAWTEQVYGYRCSCGATK